MLHVACFCVVVAISPQDTRKAPQQIEVCDSVVLAGTRQASADLQGAQAAGPGSGTSYSATYVGSIWTEGHYMHPGARSEDAFRLVIERRSDGDLYLRETRGPTNQKSAMTTRLAGGTVSQRSTELSPFVDLAGEDAKQGLDDATRWFPATLLEAALASRPTCRPGPTLATKSGPLRPVTFVDGSARPCTVLLDADERVARVETLSAHPRLGDVCEWTRFDDYEQVDGAMIPRGISRFVVSADATYEYVLALASFRKIASAGSATEGRLTDAASDDRRTGPPKPSAGFEFVDLAPSLFAVEIAAADARALVIEREKDLVLLEAPSGDDVTSDLLQALAERFPSKPVGIVACGHHHPSPSGGLRAVAAAGAVVIVPKALEAHYRLQFARPVSLGGPAVAGPTTPKFEFFERETIIEAGDNSVRLLDIESRSAHTEHYVVFYFPKSGVLFEGDLGWFPADGAPRLTARIRGLAEALKALKVTPQTIIQSWPVRRARRQTPWSTIQSLLDAASAPASRPEAR